VEVWVASSRPIYKFKKYLSFVWTPKKSWCSLCIMLNANKKKYRFFRHDSSVFTNFFVSNFLRLRPVWRQVFLFVCVHFLCLCVISTEPSDNTPLFPWCALAPFCRSLHLFISRVNVGSKTGVPNVNVCFCLAGCSNSRDLHSFSVLMNDHSRLCKCNLNRAGTKNLKRASSNLLVLIWRF